MATVIERDRPAGGVLIERNDSAAGWAVAAVIIIAILAVGAFVWARYYSTPGYTTPANNSVNVSVPGNTTPDTGGNTTQTPTGGTQPQTGTTY